MQADEGRALSYPVFVRKDRSRSASPLMGAAPAPAFPHEQEVFCLASNASSKGSSKHGSGHSSPTFARKKLPDEWESDDDELSDVAKKVAGIKLAGPPVAPPRAAPARRKLSGSPLVSDRHRPGTPVSPLVSDRRQPDSGSSSCSSSAGAPAGSTPRDE